jgi:putative ABC transport system permease protein
MKAMGFSGGYLYRLVLEQSVQLATLGFIPGTVLAALMYRGLKEVTQLPMVMEPTRGVLLAVITILMCVCSGMLAIRKLSSADPADVF